MGTPQIAVDVLEEVVKYHNVVCVYTNEPAPAKRGKTLQNSPVDLKAQELGINIVYAKSLKTVDGLKQFLSLNADITVVCAFGHILSDAVLEAFDYKSINVHVSLLPKYRGAAPIERAIINGDAQTGVTIMKIKQKLDAGDILQQQMIDIPIDMNVAQLYKQVGEIGGKLVVDTIEKMVNNEIEPIVQDESMVTLAPKVLKDEFKLDFNRKGFDLHNLVRGVYPCAYFEHKNERICVVESSFEVGDFGSVGEFINGGQAVVCADGKLIFKKLKRAGKKELDIKTFLLGFRFAV